MKNIISIFVFVLMVSACATATPSDQGDNSPINPNVPEVLPDPEAFEDVLAETLGRIGDVSGFTDGLSIATNDGKITESRYYFGPDSSYKRIEIVYDEADPQTPTRIYTKIADEGIYTIPRISDISFVDADENPISSTDPYYGVFKSTPTNFSSWDLNTPEWVVSSPDPRAYLFRVLSFQLFFLDIVPYGENVYQITFPSISDEYATLYQFNIS